MYKKFIFVVCLVFIAAAVLGASTAFCQETPSELTYKFNADGLNQLHACYKRRGR